uniref:Ribosomal protein S19 n=1 Tax=Thraustochytrium aureum TaxID=42467 RepID=Q9G4C7_9STRA|nr:ribosomal protein S19 [Thraustochytrium aureum]
MKIKRNFKIVREICNKNYLVHDGRGFKSLFVIEDIIGFKVGEFILTKKSNQLKKNNGSKNISK